MLYLQKNDICLKLEHFRINQVFTWPGSLSTLSMSKDLYIHTAIIYMQHLQKNTDNYEVKQLEMLVVCVNNKLRLIKINMSYIYAPNQTFVCQLSIAQGDVPLSLTTLYKMNFEKENNCTPKFDSQQLICLKNEIHTTRSPHTNVIPKSFHPDIHSYCKL